MDTIVQYEQVSSLGSMDTTPASLPAEMATYLSNASQDTLQPYILNQPKQEIVASSVMPPLHMTGMTGMRLPAFPDSSMGAVDVPPEAALLSSASYPFSLLQPGDKVDLSPDAAALSIPTQDPMLSSSASSFAPPESVLDSNGTIGRRRRASASLSPQSIPSNFSSLSPPRLQTTPVLEYSSATSNSSADDDSQTPPRAVIGKMLKDIAKTAIDAGNAYEHARGLQQTSKVGELRDRIVQVLDMLAHLSVANGEAPVVLPIPHQLLGLEALRSVEPPAASQPSDHTRKRCASEMEDQRGPKFLKREQQDDGPLSAILQEESLHPSTLNPSFPSSAFSVMFPVGPPSQPPSRAPSPPPIFPTASHFKPAVPLSATAFAPLTTGGTPLPPQSVPPVMPGSHNPPAYPPMPHSSWSDPIIPTSRRQHTLSLGSANWPMVLPTTSSNSGLRTSAIPPNGLQNSLPQAITVTSNVLPNTSASTISPPIGRMSRAGSISGTAFKYAKPTLPDAHTDSGLWHKSKKLATRNSQSSFYFSSEPVHPRTSLAKTFNHTSSEPATAHNSPSDDEDDNDDDDSDEEYSLSEVTSSTQVPGSASAATDMPPEFRPDVDKIFFEFLNKLCSNLDATCSKGEQIHQTLMAKKMQRLDESPDFRPFKFRILAFTNAFMDELAEKGFPEEKLPMKKVRNYLWRQQYILRFNEDGKKAKSKGNHIWSIEAKKSGDGKWEFRPFHRKLAGPPQGVAYVGLRWTWKPRIWDPQISFKKIQVTYSSPSLPSWLSWKNSELSGIPPPDAESCQITAVAKFVLDGAEIELPLTFTIAIAPVSALDGTSYARQRRPSFPCGESAPKRSTSDSALSSAPQRALNPRTRVDDRAVIQVLQNVVQRVTDEAESQVGATSLPKQGIHALAKQKHVLEQTVNAYDRALSGHGHLQARRLAVAAQHVVLQAAQTIVADKTVATSAVGGVTTPGMESVSMHELTDKTQDAIAQAVKMNGPTSNEVDIIVTATSILKQAAPLSTPPPTMNSRHPMPSTPSFTSAFPPSTGLSTLPEHV